MCKTSAFDYQAKCSCTEGSWMQKCTTVVIISFWKTPYKANYFEEYFLIITTIILEG